MFPTLIPDQDVWVIDELLISQAVVLAISSAVVLVGVLGPLVILIGVWMQQQTHPPIKIDHTPST